MDPEQSHSASVELQEVTGNEGSEDKAPDVRFRSADRIRELMDIDKDVTKLLQSASQAIHSLTAPPSDSDEDPTSLDGFKELFEARTNEYYKLVQSVAARLRRQTYALEEAKIIAPDQASQEPQPAAAPAPRPLTGARTSTTAAQQRPEAPMQITNGGLGNLDVGWLNSRNDKVGKQKEAELWAQAREHLEKRLSTRNSGDGGEDMEVDENQT